MKPINRITIFENNRRIRVLNEFGAAYERYLNGLNHSAYFREPEETADAQDARCALNRMSHEVSKIIRAAHVPVILHWSPPPIIGGRSMDIDLVLNLFRLERYQITPQEVFDVIQSAGGVYEENHSSSLWRTYNPLFWFLCLFGWIARIPFIFLEHIGLNGRHVEKTIVGKLFKGLVELFAGIATIGGTLKLFSLLDPLLQFLHLAPK